jgi:hypothetical protein
MAFTEEENTFIYNLYHFSEKSPSLAKALFEEAIPCLTITKAIISRKWGDYGHKLNSRGGYRNGVRRDDFLAACDLFGYDYQSVMENLGIPQRTLDRLSSRHGVVLLNRPRIHDFNSGIYPGRYKSRSCRGNSYLRRPRH